MGKWNQVLTDPAGRRQYLKEVAAGEEKIHAFLSLREAEALAPAGDARGTLGGMPFAVKDNIAVAGLPLTCGSKILENFTSPFSATAVEKLIAAGAVPVGKTNLDEFGMGSSTDDSALGQTNNPWDLTRVVGGSSGGSAAAVALGQVPFALGSDTGGSVRQPAAFCGVYGLKPTYGTVSRYGLVAYASSLEVIGALARDVDLLETVYKTIRGMDPRDNTSLAHPEDGGSAHPRVADLEDGSPVGVLTGDLGLTPPVQAAYDEAVETLKNLGYPVEEVELPTLEYGVPAYYTIATAEASANLARYTGIRYGLRAPGAEDPDSLVQESRHLGFGPEVKLRILLGTYVLRSGFQDQYYIRAQKIRTAIRNDFARVFQTTRAVMMPVFPTQAFPHGEGGLDPFQQKLADRFTGAANLAALPALSVPTALKEGLPTAVQFMAPAFGENRLFTLARRFREVYPVPAPPGALNYGQEAN
jgi:aspartyl-tRNA(Asn)/glutamyl-tRNA(Gln) amidotransferase subunit A